MTDQTVSGNGKITTAQAIINGGIAGFMATGPMSVMMLVLHSILPRESQKDLAPKEVTEQIAYKAGVRQEVGETQINALTIAAHFGYGLATGSLYGAFSRYLPLPGFLKGMIYGLLVWTVSYMGWLPALSILPPATKEPVQRNTTMIAAHLVWGAVTGLTTDLLDRMSGKEAYETR